MTIKCGAAVCRHKTWQNFPNMNIICSAKVGSKICNILAHYASTTQIAGGLDDLFLSVAVPPKKRPFAVLLRSA